MKYTVKFAAALVMLSAAGGAVLGWGAGPLPTPVEAATTTALNPSLEPVDDPVGELLREIGKRKLREEMNRALNDARSQGREPGEVFFNRSGGGSGDGEVNQRGSATAPSPDAGNGRPAATDRRRDRR